MGGNLCGEECKLTVSAIYKKAYVLFSSAFPLKLTMKRDIKNNS
jgi:hypothetical protein